MTKPFFIFFLVHWVLFLCVLPGWGQDDFENDDNYGLANVIVLDPFNSYAQQHTFHNAGDEDWVVFYALGGESYAVKTFNLDFGADTYIELYDTDGTTRLAWANFPNPTDDDILDWNCEQDGVYFVKIKQAAPQLFGDEVGYDLIVYSTSVPTFPAYLDGNVQSASSPSQPISHARIQASNSEMKGTGLSTGNGSFVLSLDVGTYTVTVSADGYQTKTISGVTVGGSLTVSLSQVNISPVAKADNFTVTTGGEVSGNVLLNDIDANGDNLKAVLDRNVAHGSLSLNSSGSFTYNHNGDGSLSDTFTYYATDGSSNSNMVTVTISVDPFRSAIVPSVMLLLQ